MKATLWMSCTIVVSLFYLLKSEECIDQDDNVQKLVRVGQPLAFPCTLREILHLEETNSSLTWYKSGNEAPITKNVHSRIHQNANVLWFLPATFQDTGFYECIIRYRHPTRCYKSVVRISVLNTSADLCFDKELCYFQVIPLSSVANIVCPDMNYFRDLLIHWFKGCEPLHREGIISDYIIQNVTQKDTGNYQCKATFIYAGIKYNVSRSISVTTIKVPVRKTAEILYPRNNTIEAELGSSVFVECNVSSSKESLLAITWKLNNTPVNFLFNSRIHEGYQKDCSDEENKFSTVPLNITPLKSEDYGQLFLCHAGSVAAYISIQRPPIPVITHLLGGLAAFTVIIIVPVLIYMLFKIEIVLWYRKSCHPFLHKKVSDGKIYDAYVLYPKNCAPNSFVLSVLPEVLEKQCGYKLFIFGRDDLPGKAVVSLIDETIKQSRRLIIILVPGSPSYSLIEDAPEQQIAVYSALIHDGMKVILIEMEKIKDYSDMPESIKYIKQKHGVVCWKGDLTERCSYSANTKFWKKIRYKMPPAHPRSPDLLLVPTSLNSSPAIET
ncbi:interleukin-1 receptor-like 2 [Tiliqua scincoides]|uniref:interleukin-1 receptor-like 2 n=1 Tax=Tiliqua scincoides TaxID=71010 RepID=UPI003461F292